MSNPGGCQEREYRSWFRDGDYAYALSRVQRCRGKHHLERGYAVAIHFAAVISKRRRTESEIDLPEAFRREVDRWKDETGNLSSITKAITHPSYLRIIGLAKYSNGHEIERLLLQELCSEPDHWFAALTAVTGERPVNPEDDFDQAVNAWLEWGRRKGII